MEITNYDGKFTITRDGDYLEISEWQGDTYRGKLVNFPLYKIADCITWLNDVQRKSLANMIGEKKYDKCIAIAKKYRWID